MRSIVGLAIAVVITMGSVIAAIGPGAMTPGMQAAEEMESPADDAPPYIHFDSEDWR